MPCFRPSDVPIRRKSLFSSRQYGYTQRVPCGNCLGCRQEQARQWAVRLMHERQVFEREASWSGDLESSSYFVTLTYDDERIPEYGSLCPDHFRTFIKRLRRRRAGTRISYYGCGEYGSRTKRPHYHAVLFGAKFLDRVPHFDSRRDGVFLSQDLADTWKHGYCELGSVTMASASYVAGYVRKKVNASQDPTHYERLDDDTGEIVEIEREFARMSLRPAIGRRWIERYWEDVYPRDFVVMEGVEAKPPRYYDKWMDANYPEVMEEVRDKRYEEMEDLTPEHLDAKAAIAESRVALYDRRIAV